MGLEKQSQNGTSQTARRTIVGLQLLFVGLLLPFQNCSKISLSNSEFSSLQSASANVYATKEDTPLEVDLVKDKKTLMSVSSLPSRFEVIEKVQNGELSFNVQNAQFVYKPKANFYGGDSFRFMEYSPAAEKPVERLVSIEVVSVNDLPAIKTEHLDFNMNSGKNAISLESEDVEDKVLEILLTIDNSDSMRTKAGMLEKTAAGIVYTPDPIFRGVDQHEFLVRDSAGGIGRRIVLLNVFNVFRSFQPALAVRSSACITCHADVRSQYITDFGFGSPWFFGLNTTPGVRPTSGHLYGDHDKSWSTANITGQVIVPKTPGVQFDGATRTLKQYIESQEAGKPTRSQVVEKASVFIGAPSASTIEQRFFAKSVEKIKFSSNSAESPELSGLAETMQGYYTNISTLVCDGDVFVRGTVYLNSLKVKTIEGCRLHATGPIFVQNRFTFENAGQAEASDNTNLQLVSARAVLFGVGLSHCEDPWYIDSKVESPLAFRTKDIWTIQSHYLRSLGTRTPDQEGAFLIEEAKKIPGYKDASCYSGGRTVEMKRVLVVAPQVQSRWIGNISGVVVAEIPLFALGKFSFEFDPVFLRVPVLPLLKTQDYLEVK